MPENLCPTHSILSCAHGKSRMLSRLCQKCEREACTVGLLEKHVLIPKRKNVFHGHLIGLLYANNPFSSFGTRYPKLYQRVQFLPYTGDGGCEEASVTRILWLSLHLHLFAHTKSQYQAYHSTIYLYLLSFSNPSIPFTFTCQVGPGSCPQTSTAAKPQPYCLGLTRFAFNSTPEKRNRSRVICPAPAALQHPHLHHHRLLHLRISVSA